MSSDAKLTEIQAAGETPIYMWYVPEETAMYWYSTADAITLGPTKNSLGGLFCGMLFSEKAVDVSGFKYLDTKNLGSLQSVFCGDYIPDDLSDISHWDLSGVTTWGGVFNTRGSSGYYFKQEHMNGLKHWKVPKNVSLSGAFTGNSNITSLEALSEWDTSEVVDHSGELTGLSYLTTTKGLDHIVGAGATSISSMFAGDGNIRDLDGLKKWDVSNVTNMYQVFPTVKATNLDALRNWKVSKVTNFSGMFTAMSELLDVSGIGGWNVSSGTNFSGMFSGDSKATGFGALSGWNVANGTNFSWMFSGTGIEDGRPFENWAVSPSATIEKMFYGPNLTEDEYPSWYTADRRGED